MLRDPEGIERQFLHDLLGPNVGDVLEVGCGDGRLTKDLAEISSRVLALDPDPGSIHKTRGLQLKGVQFFLGSGERIPLPDSSIDTIVYSLSLHHHPEPGRAITEAKRVLRDAGRILVLEPEAEAPTNRLYRLIHDEDDAYEKAAKAVHTSGPEIHEEGTYETLWRFDDFKEMVEYLFGYFGMEPDPVIVDSMALHLDSRRESTPLEIKDITRYWLLRPHPGARSDLVA